MLSFRVPTGLETGWIGHFQHFSITDNIDLSVIDPVTFAERHYSVKELASMWHLSPAAIRRLFRNEPGVLRYGRSKKGHQRDYVSIRIPHSVAQRVYRRCLVPDSRSLKPYQIGA